MTMTSTRALYHRANTRPKNTALIKDKEIWTYERLASEVGELVARGPHVTVGYWAGPGQIKDAPKEGWFHTGDLM
jgi:acyl-CoA synthetase (AMP-forming)/AMP-acid ligase II